MRKKYVVATFGFEFGFEFAFVLELVFYPFSFSVAVFFKKSS